MPRAYDSEAGVSELSARCKILLQIQKGWRPAASGCLPPPPVPMPEDDGKEIIVPLVVANKRSQGASYEVQVVDLWDAR